MGEVQYIEADLAYECYTSEHLKWGLILMLPNLLLWSIFIPGSILYFLKKRSD